MDLFTGPIRLQNQDMRQHWNAAAGSVTVRLELVNTALATAVAEQMQPADEQPSSAAQRGFEPGRELPHLVPHAPAAGRMLLPKARQPEAPQPIRVGIRMNRKILFLDCAEILALEAEGNYVMVRHFKASYMARERISELANRLESYGFLRIHRSVLVNIAHVGSIEPLPNGDCKVQMRGGQSYAIGRSYKKNLRRIAELWVGM